MHIPVVALIIGSVLLIAAAFAWGYREGHKEGAEEGWHAGFDEGVEMADSTYERASMLLFD